MRKQELQELKSGAYVQSVKTGEVLEVVGMDTEAGKYMLSNSKVYSTSTIKRWWNIAVVEPLVEEQDTTADTEEQTNTDTTTQDTEEQTNTNDLKDTDTQDDQLHEQQDTAVKKHIVEGNTATTNTAKTNTVQPTIQQDNLIQSLNNLIDLHNVRLEPKREYIKVSMENKRGALCMIRNSRYGSLHIDMKSKVFAQLTEEYRDLLIEQYGCRVYDKSRGYMRVFNCNDIEVLRTIILTAKSIA